MRTTNPKSFIKYCTLLMIAVFLFLYNFTSIEVFASQPTDIKNHWASSDIKSAASEGWAYMEGTKFNPNKAATREEVVWMLIGASKTIQSSIDLNKKADMTKFKDKPSSWAQGRMAIAVGNGLIKGYPDGTIRSKAPITRAEFAVLLSRQIDEQAPAGFLPYWDYIPDWAVEGIKKASEKGIIKGYPDKSFSANKKVTKAEALVMIKRWKSIPPKADTGSIEVRKSDFEKLYNQAKPFTGVPITEFAPKLKLPNDFKGSIVREIDVETLKNTSGGLRMGDLKYGGNIYSDLQIFPEENKIQIEVTDVSLFAGPSVYLLDDSSNLWRRSPPLSTYTTMKHYVPYHITDDAEAELRGLQTLDINKNVTHILIQFGEEFLAVKNPLYKEGN